MATNGYGAKEAWLNDLDFCAKKIAQRDRRGQPYNATKIKCMMETDAAFDSWVAVNIVESVEAGVKEWKG